MNEPFRDPALPVDVRVADLVGRLTLREKVGQLNQRLLGWQTYERDGDVFRLTDKLDAEIERHGGIGALYGLQRADAWSGRHARNGIDREHAREVSAMVQERIVAGSRLGIPALFSEEAPHGHQAVGGQVLPTNLGMAASWRPDLVEAAARHVAAEVRARGGHLALVSGLDILRDPRWGRGEETLGEDPLLAASFVRAIVRGMQSVPGIGVVLKHFAAQGGGIGGRNGSGAPIGLRELREIHLPAARAGLAEGALGIMAAYNDIDGVPCHANSELLTTLLRDDWGFEGIVMADLGAVDRLADGTGGFDTAGALALRSGVDISLCDRAFENLAASVEAGLIDEALVDRAVARVLGAKIRLGLLDAPRKLPEFPPNDVQQELIDSTAVLLENRLLPLPTVPERIAVLGPNADDVQSLLGDYVPPVDAADAITVLDGIRLHAPSAEVTFERGAELTSPIDGGIERAVAAAADADLAVLVLGGTSERRYDDAFEDNGAAAGAALATSGEGFDLLDLALPDAQVKLAEAVADTGTPLVIVVIAGRPHSLTSIAHLADALIFGWYPGPAGGGRIAQLLMSDREPTGRLPVSIPADSRQLPVSYNLRHEYSRRYIDGPAQPQYRFGFGLGYTEWSLDKPVVDGQWPQVSVSAPLTNTGSRSGRQIVQLYAIPRVPGLQPRSAVLVGWTHADAAAGATVAVDVAVRPDSLAALGHPVAGEIELWLSTEGASEPADGVLAPIDGPSGGGHR
ncbi:MULTISPECIES: glycoside hydrolase family 3 N-terminal domain-containing protein [unclassified Microbacterium]|uniref:glycoside hydrolase family 3 N-terminal domain-containing protein n=1 Tax=Microbacterium TaxID=33882 RepID=UPI003BA07399